MNTARFPPAPREKVPLADAPPPRASPPILERFRAMLRDREEELRADDPRPLVSEDVVPLYEDVLSELVFNSKPIITELTIIAGEQREHAAGIADAVCSRILDVPSDQKLPCLYLLDSIVKNIGSEYLRCFSVRLPEVFCEAYYQVPSNIRASMRHLFATWSAVFSSSVRRQIHNALQFSSPESRQSSSSGNIRNSESLSPRPAHGIHVNPKYLEARHRFDQSDNQWERDPHIRTNESDIENDMLEIKAAEIPKKWPDGSSNYHGAGQSRESFPVLESHGHKILPIEDYKLDRPDAIGKSDGGVVSKVAVHHDSLAHSKINHVRHSSPEASFNRVGGKNSWKEKNLLGVNPQQMEVHKSYDFTNELSAIRSRELIDAYGNSEGKSALYMKPSKIQRLDNNGINAESAAKNWQSCEEEEYVWEDMSPTLASRCSRSMPNDVNFRKPVAGIHLKKPDASILDSDFKSNWPVHAQFLPDGSSSVLGTDRASISEFATEAVHRGSQISIVQPSTSNFGHESWKSRYMPQQSSKLSPRSHGDILHPSVSKSDVAAVSHLPSGSVPSVATTLFVAAVSNLPPSSASTGADSVFGPSGIMKVDKCPPVSSTVATEKLLGQRLPSSNIIPSTTWPSINKSHPFSSIFVSSQSSQFTERLNTNTSKPMNKGIDLPFSLSWNPSDTFDKRRSNADMVISAPFQDASIVSINANNQSSIPLQFPNQDLQGSIIVPVETQIPYTTGYLSSQAQPIFPSSVGYLNQFPPQSSFLAPRVPQNSFQMHGGPLPPLPPGPPPAMPQPESFGNNSNSKMVNTQPSAFSGLLNSLVSKGLISLTPQDNIGIEFNPDNLKIRHESAINDLYANLPRQCTTCGLRFKCQEEHSSHMDWHVTKNRMSKNRKQKSSRKWFVTSKEWLSGAETVGVDAVPGFLPVEAVVDNREEKELAVPADDNQKLCALCGEPFEDFYSDEADEWMYEGAVYLNAPEGYTGGMDRFQFGPIVHAKCRSESTEVQGSA